MSLKEVKTLFFQIEDGDFGDIGRVRQLESLAPEFPYTIGIQDQMDGVEVFLILNHEEISQLIQWLRKLEPVVVQDA